MPTPQRIRPLVRKHPKKRIYAVAVDSASLHHCPDYLPASLVAWMKSRHPDMRIDVRLDTNDCMAHPGQTPLEMPNPVFLLRFNDEQAAEFMREWSAPPLCDLAEADDLVLVKIDAECVTQGTEARSPIA